MKSALSIITVGFIVMLSASLSAQPAPSNIWVVNSSGSIFKWNGSGWSPTPGLAKDVGVGANGSVWVIGTNPVPGGYGIYQWNGSTWINRPGGAVRIDVGPNGDPWVVNSAGNIFHWTGGNWRVMPGLATDIGVAANGSVWIIGTNSVPGGYGIYEWSGKYWINHPGGAVRLDVGPAGYPWVVNSNGEIFHWLNPGWKLLPGRARDIALGRAGSWIIGTNSVAGGYGIYRWMGSSWSALPGGAVEISLAGK